MSTSETFFQTTLDSVEKELRKLCSHNSIFFQKLYDGCRHLIFSPAKRIRPLLTLTLVDALDKEFLTQSITPACAIELLHTYSLIHDDLPCMDNSEYRRGSLTLHRVYDEATALLIGDGLIAFSFEILAKALTLSAEKKIALINSLTQAASFDGIVGGQCMDLDCHENLKEIHLRKTASLFKASAEFAGIITDAKEDTMRILRRFGETFGVLFQALDDLTDNDNSKSYEENLEYAITAHKECLQSIKSIPGNIVKLQALVDVISEPLLCPSLTKL